MISPLKSRHRDYHLINIIDIRVLRVITNHTKEKGRDRQNQEIILNLVLRVLRDRAHIQVKNIVMSHQNLVLDQGVDPIRALIEDIN